MSGYPGLCHHAETTAVLENNTHRPVNLPVSNTQYGSIDLVDDDALRNAEVSPDLGTIRVEYRRATLNGRADEYQPISVVLTGHVHESQKPSVHSAT